MPKHGCFLHTTFVRCVHIRGLQSGLQYVFVLGFMDGFISREGTLKVGDRILMINAVNGSQKSLSDAFLLLARPQTNVHLLVEYDVSVMGEHVMYLLLVCLQSHTPSKLCSFKFGHLSDTPSKLPTFKVTDLLKHHSHTNS